MFDGANELYVTQLGPPGLGPPLEKNNIRHSSFVQLLEDRMENGCGAGKSFYLLSD